MGLIYRTHSNLKMKNQAVNREKTSENKPFNFVVCGDPHKASGYTKTVKQIISIQPDFVLIVGDLVNSGNNKDEWDEFFRMSADLLQNTRLIPVIGNHDHKACQAPFDDGTNPPSLYQKYFQLPGNGKWYSFDYGGCHFVILHIPDKGQLKVGDEQYNWLVKDLTEVSTTDKPVLVFQHTPCFTSTTASWAYDGSVLPELFHSYKNVVLDFAGHIHTYERSIWPDRENGKNFITTGGSGLLYSKYPVNAIGNPYQVAAADILHFCKVSVSANVSIDVEVIKTADGTTYEEFSINLQ